MKRYKFIQNLYFLTVFYLEYIDKKRFECYNTTMTYKHKKLDSLIPQIHCSINKLFTAYSYFYSKDFVFSGEYHDAWELVYVCNGEVVIDTPEYSVIVSKGQVLLHSPNERHKIRANNTCCNMFIFSFECSCDQLYDIAHKPIDISPLSHNYLFTALEEGLSCLAGKNHIPDRHLPIQYASEQVIKNTLELTLIALIRQNISPPQATQQDMRNKSNGKTTVELIISYMKENIQNKLNLEDIAKHIGYSVSYMCAVFKKATGLSVKSYFNKLRIDTAKHLLSNNDISIQQISDYLGFDSMQYFSLRFKKETGLSPLQYASYLKLQNFSHSSIRDSVHL